MLDDEDLNLFRLLEQELQVPTALSNQQNIPLGVDDKLVAGLGDNYPDYNIEQNVPAATFTPAPFEPLQAAAR